MAKKRAASAGGSKKSSRSAGRAAEPRGSRLYTLEVFLLSGPLSKKFVKKNPAVSRVIQIRGDQTLEDLHEIIFKAYDRFDEHMYEFQFGKGPMQGPRYVLPGTFEMQSHEAEPPAGRVDQTTLDSLDLETGQAFGYWFDFGDDWWHQINVEAIEPAVPAGQYPRIVSRVGESPPQYLDEEE